MLFQATFDVDEETNYIVSLSREDADRIVQGQLADGSKYRLVEIKSIEQLERFLPITFVIEEV